MDDVCVDQRIILNTFLKIGGGAYTGFIGLKAGTTSEMRIRR